MIRDRRSSRQLVLWLALALCTLLLAACGGNSGEDDAVSSDDETQSPETESEDTSADDDSEMSDDEPDAEPEGEAYTVGLLNLVQNPTLIAIQDAFVAELAAGGYVEGENLTIISANADGDFASLPTLVQSQIDEGVDILAITTTPMLQAALNVTQDLDDPPLIVFNAVTDPYAAGIAVAPDDHPEWIIGAQMFPNIDVTVNLLQELFPGGTIGYLYNPSEANSVAQTEELEKLLADTDLTLEAATITDSSEVRTAAESLIALNPDVLFYSQDSTVGDGVAGLIQVANDNAIPLISNDPQSVSVGAALGIVVQFEENGRQTGEMAAQYLDGSLDPATFVIPRTEGFFYMINNDSIAAQGLEVPQEILDQAVDQTPEG